MPIEIRINGALVSVRGVTDGAVESSLSAGAANAVKIANIATRDAPSEYWFSRPLPAGMLRCDNDHRAGVVPPCYVRRVKNINRKNQFTRTKVICEECALVDHWNRLQRIQHDELRGWSSQVARVLAVLDWKRCDYATAIELMRRIDESAKQPEEKHREFIDPQQRAINARGFYASPEPDPELPGEANDTLEIERRLHELTGWVNDCDATADQVRALLELNLTHIELTGSPAPGLSAGRLRGRIWRLRDEFESDDVPKTKYERADYEL